RGKGRGAADVPRGLGAGLNGRRGGGPRSQRPAGNLLDHTEAHRAGQARCRKAMARRFLELQQAAGIAEQHFAVVRERHAARGAAKQRTSGLELETLDLLADGRLRQVEPFGSAMEAAAIRYGNEGTEQLEIQHMIDPYLRSIIL